MSPRAAAAALLVLFLAAYSPDVGHGFIKDDFRWIHAVAGRDSAQLLTVFSENVGFYRPLVSLTFALDHAVWDLNARGYGFTNLMLCLVDAALIIALARRLGLSSGAAVLAGSLWALNLRIMDMALLWLSGRTALLVVLVAVAATHAVLARRFLLAGVLSLAAMLCKEEAVALPALFTVFLLMDARASVQGNAGGKAGFRAISMWPLWLALLAYLVLRAQSGAFGPTNAPPFYQFSLSPPLLMRNVGEYADRAASPAVAVVLLLLVATRSWRVPFVDEERRALRLAVVWVPAAYALTVALPVRSSLYAVLPSVGVCLAAAAFASRALRTDPLRARPALIALMVIVTALMPVYRSRNRPWVELAERSTGTLDAVTPLTEGKRPGHVVLIDDPAERSNFESTFGNLLPDALSLFSGAGWTGEIISPASPVPGNAVLIIRLENDRLRVIDPGA